MPEKWLRFAMALTLASALLVTQLPTAWADDGYVGVVGSSVVPMQNDQVTMAAERIDALIQGEEAYVTCIFTFTNVGKAATVLMGFPQLSAPESRGAPELLDFTAHVDGNTAPVTFKPQAPGSPDTDMYAGWYTFSVPFESGQTRVVRNTYHGIPSGFSNGDKDFGYILHTGASWLGPIGQVDVTVRWLHDRDVLPESVRGTPDGYEVSDHLVHWHFTNLKPTQDDDISLYFRPAYGLPHPGGEAAASSGQVVPAAQLPYPPPFFGDGDAATAWRSSGEAAGAWLAWMGEGYPVGPATTGLGILPGAASSSSEFKAHGRPKQVLVKFAILKPGGSAPYLKPNEPFTDLFDHTSADHDVVERSFTLNDSPTWQFLSLPQRLDASAFQIVVQSVYPGSRYNDVAVSEVLFPLLPDDISGAHKVPSASPLHPFTCPFVAIREPYAWSLRSKSRVRRAPWKRCQ